jgi:predicted ABC-type ATPase
VQVPRLRVFAGPNGSGKSTIKHILAPELIYTYVNADDLEREAKERGEIDLAPFAINRSQDEFRAFFSQHPLVVREGLAGQAERFVLVDSSLRIDAMTMNSYHASVIADFLRHQLLENGASFTFETVMSDPSKVAFIEMAKAAGYRTYLYFVATENPEINLNRIAIRVAENGHDVAPDKVRSRYRRSLALLPEAILATSRAFLFDNSGEQAVLEVEITDASVVEYKFDEIPEWCSKTIVMLEELINRA